MFDIVPKNDRQQALRIQYLIVILSGYGLMALLSMFGCSYWGIQISTTGLTFLISALIITAILFYTVFRSGLNKLFKDPDLFMIQSAVGITWLTVAMYFMGSFGGITLSLYLVIFTTGFLKLEIKQFIILTGYTILNYTGFILFLFYQQRNPEIFRHEGIHLVTLTGLLFLFSLIGHLVSRLRKKIKITNKKLFESYRSIRNAKAVIVMGLAKLAEYRDQDTGEHLERIQEYTRVISNALSKKEKYKQYITPEYIDDLYLSSILHDIGKVGIPDAILLKPGKLTEEEFEVVKLHAKLGGDALSAAEAKISGKSFLTLGKEISYHHHERWDGTGYPSNLKGEDIPLSARLVSLVDVYDAITSDRVYKTAYSHEEAKEILRKERGKHFDPDIVDAFLSNEKEFKRIKIQYSRTRISQKKKSKHYIQQPFLPNLRAMSLFKENLERQYKDKPVTVQKISDKPQIDENIFKLIGTTLFSDRQKHMNSNRN